MNKHSWTISTRSVPRRRWVTGLLSLVFPAMVAACSSQIADNGQTDAAPTVYGVDLQNAKQDLLRLQVQMEYLTEQMDMLRRELERANSEGENVEMKPELRRFQLLQSMYMQRLEAYETLRLEQETNRRLGLAEDQDT